MAIGTLNGTTSSQYCISKIEWTGESFLETNKSRVKAELFLRRTNNLTTYGSGWNFEISIDGQKSTYAPGYTEIGSEWVLVATATADVEHLEDGTKDIVISAGGGCAGTSVTSISCSGTVELDNIARASIIASAADVNLGEACNVAWIPASRDYSYKIQFCFENWSHTTDIIRPDTIEPYVYTEYQLPLEELAPLITGNPPIADVTVKLTTYQDSQGAEQIGPENEKAFKVTVPNNDVTRPNPNMLLSAISPIEGLYIQGKSKVRAAFSGEGKYGASVVSYSLIVGGKNCDNPYESEYLSQPGDYVVRGVVTDSRGYTGTDEVIITVLPYSIPKIKVDVCDRCDEEGKLADNGIYLWIAASREYSKLILNGEQNNFCDIMYRYKLAADGEEYCSWRTLLDGDSLSSDSVEAKAVDNNQSAEFAVNASYLVQIAVQDTAGELRHTTFLIPTARVYWHRDGRRRSFTFGGYVEDDNTFAISDDIIFKAMGGIAPLGLYDEKDFHTLNDRTGYYYGTHTPDVAGCSNYPVNKLGILFVTAIKDVRAHQIYCTDDGEKYFQSWTKDGGWSAVTQL